MKSGSQKLIEIGYVVVLCIVLGWAFALSFSRAIRAGNNHDENQFVASAELLVNHALLPYRDYPYFHMPNLVFVYALIYSFTGHIVLGARLFSVVCATGAVALLMFLIKDFFRGRNALYGLVASAGCVFLLLPNPLFAFTSGFAWNHDLPVLLTLAAVAFIFHGMRRNQGIWWAMASGISLGLAAGTRLSFASAAIPLAGCLLFYPGSWKDKTKLLAVFILGTLIALLPAIYLFLLAPKQFIFGNFIYPQLNTVYRQDTGFYGPANPMTLVEKLEYLWNIVIAQPGNLLLFLATLFFGYSCGLVDLLRKERLLENVLLLSLIPFLLVGSLLPSPAWYQYFYTLVPFALLAVAFGLSRLTYQQDLQARWIWIMFIQLVLLVNFYHHEDYRRVAFLRHPDLWRPLMAHKLGQEIASYCSQGRILTFTPAYALEGGADIYPEFATGVFAWRTASYLDEEQRKELGMISDADLERFLALDPPGAILVGLEPLIEEPLNAYALQYGYRKLEIQKDVWVWLQ